MAFSIGSQIGTATLTDGSDTIDVTLTADVPAGTDTQAEYIVIFSMYEVEGFTPGDLSWHTTAQEIPAITLPVTATPDPYFGVDNFIAGLLHFPAGQEAPFSPGEGLSQRGVFSNYAVACEILHPLSMGDTINVDCSNVSPTFRRISANVHRITGLRGDGIPNFPNYSYSQAQGNSGSGHYGGVSGLMNNFYVIGRCSFDLPDSSFPKYPPRWGGIGCFYAFSCESNAGFGHTGVPSTPFWWTGAGGAFGTELDEIGDGFYGTLYADYSDPSLHYPWRMGYSMFDFGITTPDGNVCANHATLQDDDILPRWGTNLVQAGVGQEYVFGPIVVAPTYQRVYGLEIQLTDDGVEAPVTVRTSAQSQQA